MPDMYLLNREKLKGKPKRTISDYVERNGILVPRRFDTFKEAKAAGVPIIARTEHDQDYDGVSGLVRSIWLRDINIDEIKDDSDIKKLIFKEKDFKYNNRILFYCSFLGRDKETFIDEVSFSLWEKLEGYNRSIIADSSIEGRYHITTSSGLNFFNYTIFENGCIVFQTCFDDYDKLPPDLEKGLKDLIGLYERVRNLGMFEPNHCPIVELQTFGEKNYFLQYHRVRDFEPATFILDRGLKKDEVEIDFVRGATPPEGMYCKTTLAYYKLISENFDNWKLPEKEDGSFDLLRLRSFYSVFFEIMVRRRRLEIIRGTINSFSKFGKEHMDRSALFKPEVSVMLPSVNKILSPEELSVDIMEKSLREKQDQFVDLYIVSDGKKAYLKRV